MTITLNGEPFELEQPLSVTDLLAQLQAITGVTTEVDQGVTFEHYDFNQANEFLADPNVRKAFALCIDRQEIVDTLITRVTVRILAMLNPAGAILQAIEAIYRVIRWIIENAMGLALTTGRGHGQLDDCRFVRA